MRSPARHGLLLATAMLAACGGAAAPILNQARQHTPARSSGNVTTAPAHLLVEAGTPPGNGIVMLDTKARRTTLSLPSGALAPSGSRLYAVTHAASGASVLEAIDTRDGAVVASVGVPAAFSLPVLGPEGRPVGLSPNAERLVLTDEDPGSDTPRAVSHFLVYETTALAQKPEQVVLSGDFAFDGISNDGRSLYLLADLGVSAGGDRDYDVRRYDVASARLDPQVIVDKRTGEGSMTGVAIDRVTSRDGAWQYTVYGFGPNGPFVHALNLDSGIAACIDVPGVTGEPELDLLWAVVASHDGSHVYAVNAAAGAVLEMASGDPWEQRKAQLSTVPAAQAAMVMPWDTTTAEAKRIAFGAAAISPDDGTLYALGIERISVIDTAGLRVRGGLGPQRALSSLALSANGRDLYAVTFDAPGALLQIDTAHGAWTTIAGVDAPLGVLRVVS
jgi:hypothetical protein